MLLRPQKPALVKYPFGDGIALSFFSCVAEPGTSNLIAAPTDWNELFIILKNNYCNKIYSSWWHIGKIYPLTSIFGINQMTNVFVSTIWRFEYFKIAADGYQ